MQIFILLYIEAGSYIVEDESTWEFVVLQVPSFSSSSRPSLTTTPGTRSGNEEGRPGWQRTTSRDTLHYIRSTAFRKESG